MVNCCNPPACTAARTTVRLLVLTLMTLSFTILLATEIRLMACMAVPLKLALPGMAAFEAGFTAAATVMSPASTTPVSANPMPVLASRQKPADPRAASQQVDVVKSRVYTFVGKTGLGHEHGIEGRIKSGHLTLDTDTNAGQIIFDMTTFDADTDAARRYVGLSGSTDASTRQQVNTNMRGAAVLNVRRFPTATFQVVSAKSLEKLSPRKLPLYELAGQFTLHGVTRPLTVQAEVQDQENAWHIRGNFTILQRQFGITPYSKAFGAVGVTNALRIYGDLYVTK